MSLPHAILTILEREKSSGYDLARHFALTAGQIWSATHQQIYLELGKLHQAGLVDFELVNQDGKPDKKVYNLTADGKQELRQWLVRPAAQKRVRESLLIKVLGSHLVAGDHLLEELQRQRQEQQQMLSEHRMLLADLGDQTQLSPADQAVWLTLRRSILEREAWLVWADDAEAMISPEAVAEAETG